MRVFFFFFFFGLDYNLNVHPWQLTNLWQTHWPYMMRIMAGQPVGHVADGVWLKIALIMWSWPSNFDSWKLDGFGKKKKRWDGLDYESDCFSGHAPPHGSLQFFYHLNWHPYTSHHSYNGWDKEDGWTDHSSSLSVVCPLCSFFFDYGFLVFTAFVNFCLIILYWFS